MKTKFLILFIIPFLLLSCDDWTDVEKVNIETEAPSILKQLLERDMKKWAEEKELQKAEDESTEEWNKRVALMYEKYWKNLREYKKSDHPIVYGWFGGWSATDGIDKSFISKLPDSVDVVSIWGGTSPFEEGSSKWADLKIAQEVKGIKVLLCWQTGTAGLGLPGGVDEFNARHADKDNLGKAKAYAVELTKFIKDHNLNGYDIDWEPRVGNHSGCGNLYYDCDNELGQGIDNAIHIKTFIEEMGKNFGPKQQTNYNPRKTGTMFLFDGELDDMASRLPEHGIYFDYLVEQNYYGIETQYSSSLSKIQGYNKKKHILSDEFEKSIGGVCGDQGDLTCAERKADYIKANNYGGWAAYHIELEQPFGYKNIHSVIRRINPRDIYNPFYE